MERYRIVKDVTLYYFAGATRVAMRKYTIPQSMTVEYFLGDHLGSTSITTDSAGAKISEIRYKPWGEIRSSWTSQPATTPAYKLASYTFTGQFSYLDDPTTSGVTEGFGLLFYNARWYDPVTGRFAQADSIVPGGVQGLDRYAYVNNDPLRYTDPTGHKCTSDDGCETPHGDKSVEIVISKFNRPDGLTEPGNKAYDGLIMLSSMNGWWNADGKFYLDESLAMLIWHEAGNTVEYSCDENENCSYSLPGPVRIAITVKWQQYCSGGWNSANCFNKFWGYYQAITDIPTAAKVRNDYLEHDLSSPDLYVGDVYFREADQMLKSQTIFVTSSTPSGWATVVKGGTVASALNVGVSYQHNFGNEIFFVVSAQEQDAICKKLGRAPGCNLSNIK